MQCRLIRDSPIAPDSLGGDSIADDGREPWGRNSAEST